MSHIFISYVEEDSEIAREIADGLEAAGYSTWYYERDTVPGVSYLSQITQAIDRCKAIVLLVSSNSINSSQVTREVVHAFEKDKPFFPVLHGISHIEFQERQPEWRHALGSSASVSLGAGGASACASRLLDGLVTLDIHPVTDQTRIAIAETAPASYTPRHLADRIIAARPSIEGERKQVTVLIGDVTGFISSAGELDPEEEHDMIKQCLDMFAGEIHRYEGTIIELKGDRIVAFFGAPIAHEYAPQRALYAALGIQQRLSRYAEQLKEKGIEFESRIAVNTGPIVITRIGDDLSMEYTSVGDTVGLASDMNHSAKAGTILASENTHYLSQEYFEFKPAVELKAKGSKEPARAYQVLGLGKARTRLRAAMARGLTPFVGRERELELLMDSFERAGEGSGQAISIMGEAGVGKSRLLHEFRNAIDKENVTFLVGRCLSYSRGVPYHPVADFLRSNFDIIEADDDKQIREKVRKGLDFMRVEEAQTLPYLLELLSVKDSGIDTISMSPEARRERTMEALKRLVLKGSEFSPLVIAIEDLHWVDKSTEDTMKHIMDGISGARVLMICTYRPDYIFTWGGRSYHNQITLNRLSNRESMAIVSHLLGTDDIDKALQDTILKKTEGIPFFIEEFIRSLKDLGMIAQKEKTYCLARDIRDLAIPSTIQEVIMARVDSLPDAAKEVLQTGSAIEREFSYELLRRVIGTPELELVSHLSVLRDSELLYERGIFPQSTYIFKHALTREVVYDSILTSRKRKLHVKIGDAIEEFYKADLHENYETLAEHYIAGENWEKGAEYCRLASRKAEKAAAFNNSIEYRGKNIECLERLPRSEDTEKKIVDSRTALGLYYLQMNHYFDAQETVAPIIDMVLDQGRKKRVSQTYTIMGSYELMVQEDFFKALRYLEDALKIADELDDPLSMFTANLWLGIALCMKCEFERASCHLGRSLDINIAANILWGISTIKAVIGGLVHDLNGNINLGYETTYEAVQLAESSGDIYSKTHAYIYHGCSCYYKGFLSDAEHYLSQGIELSQSLGSQLHVVLGGIWVSEIYFDMGEYIKSQSHIESTISQLGYFGYSPSWSNVGNIVLARANTMIEGTDINLNEIFKWSENNKIKTFEGMIASQIGEIILNIDDNQMLEAEDWINKAIEADTRNGMRFNLARDYALHAELFKRKGDTPKAKEHLTKAIDIFRECGSDGWVERYEEELAKL